MNRTILTQKLNEIISNLTSLSSIGRVISSRANLALLEEIINSTNYLDISTIPSERIYHILHDLTSPQICKYCNVSPLGL